MEQHPMPYLVLASQSPFRRMLMENAGLNFVTEAAQIDEREAETRLSVDASTPAGIAEGLAVEKAKDVATRHPDAIVIGSDQTLSLGDRVFHKPVDRDDARHHLRAMSGKTHQLNCGVALVQGGVVLWQHVSVAHMHMRSLSEGFIDRYLDQAGDRILSSVGAYQLEREGVQLFDRIEGDYFTILGLPLLPMLAKLRDLGAIDA